MSGFTLTLAAPPAVRIDLAGVVPSALAGRNLAEVERLEVPAGTRRLPLGELFRVAEAPEGLLAITGDGRLDGVGAGLDAGEIRVEGDVGHGAGTAMGGGRLVIGGSAGDGLGVGLSGGRIEVAGSAGDGLGSAGFADRKGQSGGAIIVAGNAGARAAERMRGGVMLIGGGAGAGLAAAMIAGTVGVGGAIGPGAGEGMRRGTIFTRAVPAGLAGDFGDAGPHELIALQLLWHRTPDLARWSGRGAPASVQRLVGDRAVGGQGELLVF